MRKLGSKSSNWKLLKIWACLVFAFLTGLSSCLSQTKKVVDNSTYLKWDKLGEYKLTNNGKYVWYSYGNLSKGESFVLSSFDADWQTRLPDDTRSAQFTEDSQFLIYTSSQNITIFSLKERRNVCTFRGLNVVLSQHWNSSSFFYSNGASLILRNIYTGQERIFSQSAIGYFLNPGKVLIEESDRLIWLDLDSNQERVIFSGGNVENVCFTDDHSVIAFRGNTKLGSKIYCYESGKGIAQPLSKVDLSLHGKNYEVLPEEMHFSKGGSDLICTVLEIIARPMPDTTIVSSSVTLWHYKDVFLQSEQAQNPELGYTRKHKLSIGIASRRTMLLNDSVSEVVFIGKKYALATEAVNGHDAYWQKKKSPFRLISFETGSISTIEHNSTLAYGASMSPDEHFVFWTDMYTGDYYCFDLLSKRVKNVTAGIIIPQEERFLKDSKYRGLNFIGWLHKDQKMLFNDKYDVWLVDPKGASKPFCITRGYGRKSNIQFRNYLSQSDLSDLGTQGYFYLAAMDEINKHNGFCKVSLKTLNIEKINLEPYLYYFPEITKANLQKPNKAKHALRYILVRQGTSDAPNVVTTVDFETFKQVSKVAPEKSYNWMSVSLQRWRLENGKMNSGLLYTPENLDTTKKYPIIFNYYEERSGERYLFRNADLTRGNIDVAWFVSNGFLVFMPDILVDSGKTGNSALKSVESAADYLTRSFKYIDSTRMGIQGHSFGGYETYHIVTHSKKFAAACGFAGTSNMISSFGQLSGSGSTRTMMYEVAQSYMRTTPWDNPEGYIKNSPIFKIGNVTTPLLMIHNKDDGAVPFAQAVELYIGLRRQSKLVWLLDYQNQRHGLGDKDNAALDCSLRIEQFFDHYLKNYPPANWMKYPIPYREREYKSGLKRSEIN